MKRTHSVTWQTSQKTPTKKRTMSHTNSSTRTLSTNNDETQPSFSHIKKLLDISFEEVNSDINEEITINPKDISNFESELFSDAIITIQGMIESIETTDEHKILKIGEYTVRLNDEYRNIDFHTGMMVTIFDCDCCSNGGMIHGFDISVCDGMILMIKGPMISVTMLCESFSCLERCLIRENIMDISFEYAHPSIVTGIIMHYVIEQCIMHQTFSLKFIVETIKLEIQKRIKLLYTCNVSTKTCMFECTRYIKNILKLKDNKLFKGVFDVEKRVVSHKYNLIGNIDAVLNVEGNRVPLEIKTGKRADFRHRAQTIFYLMMLKDTFKNCKDFGVLLYTYELEIHNIKLKHNEVKALMILRNKIAAYHFILQKRLACNKNFIIMPAEFKTECSCSGVEYCKILQRIFSGDGFKAQFLKEQWLSINEEEERQKRIILIPAKFESQTDKSLIVLVESNQTECLLSYIEIYNECENRLCFGRITSIEGNKFMILLSNNINLCSYLNLYIGNTKNEMFYKTMRYSLLNIAHSNTLVDWEEIENSRVNNNISQISHLSISPAQHSFKAFPSSNDLLKTNNKPSQSIEKYLELFSQKISQSPMLRNKIAIPEIFKNDFLLLNENQRSALFLALNCENYKIIHGFPGTGKSKVIVLLIKIMCHLKKKILLICYTNLAIDNILSRLAIKYYRALKDTNMFETTEKLKEYFDSIELVAGTCYSFTDIVFLQRRFEMCIIDEASQQHFLLTLIPISLCNRFVLVGDHLQLKPLSNSSLLNISLFEYLAKKNVSELRTQYRMSDEIMKLSNQMFYNNKMKGTGSEGHIEFLHLNSLETQVLKIMQEIGTSLVILCYFNSTVFSLRKCVDCRIETVDRFQGSEADTILVVFYPIVENSIMNSKERLNVALTRAKKRLILLGDEARMMKIGIFKEMFEILKNFCKI